MKFVFQYRKKLELIKSKKVIIVKRTDLTIKSENGGQIKLKVPL